MSVERVRQFNGSTHLIRLDPVSGNLFTEKQTFTLAAVVKFTSVAKKQMLLSIESSPGVPIAYLGLSAAGKLITGDFFAGDKVGTTVLEKEVWYTVAVTKAAGVTTPVFHFYNHATGTWTHENASGSLNMISGGDTAYVIGARGWGTPEFLFEGSMARFLMTPTVFTNEQTEQLFTVGGWANNLAAGKPQVYADLNQASVGEAVENRGTAGADVFQTETTNPTVVEENPPGPGAFTSPQGETGVTFSNFRGIATYGAGKLLTKFEYGKSEALGSVAGEVLDEVATQGSVKEKIVKVTGLEPGTTYFYRTYRKDEKSGQVIQGEIRSFTTNPIPLIETFPASQGQASSLALTAPTSIATTSAVQPTSSSMQLRAQPPPLKTRKFNRYPFPSRS